MSDTIMTWLVMLVLALPALLTIGMSFLAHVEEKGLKSVIGELLQGIGVMAVLFLLGCLAGWIGK
jgi:hypothetical protein